MGTNLVDNKNNLFDYATSELSQDAFICWLCNWVNFKDEELSQEERELKRLATRFIEKMMNGDKNNDNEKLDERKINIKKRFLLNAYNRAQLRLCSVHVNSCGIIFCKTGCNASALLPLT